MRFWDTSALVPLLIQETLSLELQRLVESDPGIVVWWGSSIEYRSAISRSLSEDRLPSTARDEIWHTVGELEASVFEVPALEAARSLAKKLVERYPNLRAADALQLAAAKLWSLGDAEGQSFVCLDRRLRDAARQEGFTVLPEIVPFPE